MGKKKANTIQKIMVEATRLHTSGEVAKAALLYRKVLVFNAKHVEANHLLGLTMHQFGNSEEGLPYMERSIELNSKDPGYYSNYGSALKALDRLEEAAKSYETAMLLDPNFLAAPYNAGELYCMLERYDDGERVYRRALEIKSDVADIWSNLGVCLVKKEDWDGAIESLEKALSLESGNASAHFGLGHVYDQQDRSEEARKSTEEAMRLGHPEAECLILLASICERSGNPQEVVAHLEKLVGKDEMTDVAYHSLARAYQDLGLKDQAYEAVEQALVLEPLSSEALCTKSSLLIVDARFEEAVRSANKAAFCDRESEVAYSNLGTGYRGLSRLTDAKDAYEEAVKLNPDRAENSNNLALVLNDLGELEEMERLYNRALELAPDYANCMSNFATALIALGRLSEAESHLLRAIELDDNNPAPWGNLGRVRYELGDFEGARQASLNALARNNGNSQTRMALAATQIANDQIDDETLFRYHCEANEAIQASNTIDEANSLDLSACVERASCRGKLRLGFVSADFKVHSVAYFLIPLFEELDRERFEVYCYSGVSRPDQMTAKFQTLSNGWRVVSKQPSHITVAQVREDQIDLLFDLTGYTAGNVLEVFARRSAPVQITWLGYAHSTALEQMDYRIVDEDTDPEGITLNTEELVRLPGSFIGYDSLDKLPDEAPPPSVASGSVTFGSFNNIVKLSETTVDLFAGALLAVEGSNLILKSHQTADTKVQERIFNLFAERGVERERIQLLPRYDSKREHFESYGQVDIALDTYPYNGTTTTCEALAMGVPVVTLAGARHAARVGCSLLRSVDLPDLVAETPEGFAATAKRLAENDDRLVELRHDLRGRLAASPLGDSKAFARNMETAIEGIWSRFTESSNNA